MNVSGSSNFERGPCRKVDALNPHNLFDAHQLAMVPMKSMMKMTYDVFCLDRSIVNQLIDEDRD